MDTTDELPTGGATALFAETSGLVRDLSQDLHVLEDRIPALLPPDEHGHALSLLQGARYHLRQLVGARAEDREEEALLEMQVAKRQFIELCRLLDAHWDRRPLRPEG